MAGSSVPSEPAEDHKAHVTFAEAAGRDTRPGSDTHVSQNMTKTLISKKTL